MGWRCLEIISRIRGRLRFEELLCRPEQFDWQASYPLAFVFTQLVLSVETFERR
jgi:hypothetical protein